MRTLFFVLIFISPLSILAQGEGNQLIRDGNKLYQNGKYEEASGMYDEALDKDHKSFEGAFNLGDALYRQEKFEEAATQFEMLSNQETSSANIAKAYHNLGNSYMKSNKVDKGIAAYKKALLNNPTDYDSKYNLSYAQRLKKKQEEQEQQKKDDEKQDKDKKDEKGDEEKQEQAKPEPGDGVSKEDAERLLEALKNEDEKLQKELMKKKQESQVIKIQKPW